MQPKPTYEEMLARIEHLEQQVAENSRSEKALRESRERYDRLSRNLQVVVYAAFPNKLTGKFYASEQIEAITGLPATRFLKEAGLFSQTIHPDDIDMVTRTVQNAIDKKTRMDLEYRIISSANEIKWIRDKASVVACEEGACKIEGLMEDVTQSRRSEKELEAASKRWQDTFNAMREPLALLDLEYRILQCNTALRRLAPIARKSDHRPAVLGGHPRICPRFQGLPEPVRPDGPAQNDGHNRCGRPSIRSGRGSSI
jgi:PAS domain-containing protein